MPGLLPLGWCSDLHKILLIIGPTRAGKGTIGRILKMLLGADNVAGPNLASLGTQFGLMPLIGKPLAVISDARTAGRNSVVVERLLTISGEDPLTVDIKLRKAWTGQLPTRFVIMSNELPIFGGALGAIAFRLVTLVLRLSWLGKEDKELTRKLADELPGILNWGLDGLGRLEEEGRFTEPKSSDDATIALLDQTSPISAFMRDACDTGPLHQVGTDDIFAAWKAWCEENERRHGNVQAFGKLLRAAVPGVRQSQPREGSARYHVYEGIQRHGCVSTARVGGHNGSDRVPPRAEQEPDADSPDSPARGGRRETPIAVTTRRGRRAP